MNKLSKTIFRNKKFIKKIILSLIITTIIFIIITETIEINNQHAKNPISKGQVSTYFCPYYNCTNIFLQTISSAKNISCALYDLDIEPIAKILREKNSLVVLDEDSEKQDFAIIKKGIGLMHNKFCVINKTTTITGSFNPVKAGTQDYNNIIVIQSKPIAKFYLSIIESILTEGLSKNKFILDEEKKRTIKKFQKENIISNSKTKIEKIIFKDEKNSFIHNNFLIKAYKCPEDECKEKIKAELTKANQSIYFSLFTFTDKEISSIIKRKKESGIIVKGIIESFQNPKYNQYYYLTKNNSENDINNNDHNNESKKTNIILETTKRIQHNKLFVIDEKTTITGSFNPTKAADTINDENIMIIHNSNISKAFKRYIEEIIKQSDQ